MGTRVQQKYKHIYYKNQWNVLHILLLLVNNISKLIILNLCVIHPSHQKNFINTYIYAYIFPPRELAIKHLLGSHWWEGLDGVRRPFKSEPKCCSPVSWPSLFPCVGLYPKIFNNLKDRPPLIKTEPLHISHNILLP